MHLRQPDLEGHRRSEGHTPPACHRQLQSAAQADPVDECDRGETRRREPIEYGEPASKKSSDLGRRATGEDVPEVGTGTEAPGLPTANDATGDRRVILGVGEVCVQLIDGGQVEYVVGSPGLIEPECPDSAIVALAAPGTLGGRGRHGHHLRLEL